MVFGSISSVIDLPQVAFWLFFLFFLGLVWWLRRQDQLQGYPLKASPFNADRLEGAVGPPSTHTYILNEGGTSTAPHYFPPAPMSAEPLYSFDGTPLTPIGNPLVAGIGPGSWVMRSDVPMLTEGGHKLLQPMRRLPEWQVGKKDADPRGMRVFDWTWAEVGVVHDCWIDKGIKIIRLLEVEIASGERVLVPIYHTQIKEKSRRVRVTALSAEQFAEIPRPREPDTITAREDERLNAYFHAGRFYRRRRTEKRLVFQ